MNDWSKPYDQQNLNPYLSNNSEDAFPQLSAMQMNPLNQISFGNQEAMQ